MDTFRAILQEAQFDVQAVAEDERKLQDYLSQPFGNGQLKSELEQMFESGMPWNEPFYTSLRQRFVTQQLRGITERVHLPLPRSRRVMIAPDFTQEVPAGFCVLQLRHWGSDIAGAREVVLLRNPCYDDRRLLKLKVMEHPPADLKHLHDICILSAQLAEVTSPAEVLEGDYDGDEVLAIWDRRIVEAICPSDTPPSSSRSGSHESQQGTGTLSEIGDRTTSAVISALADARQQHKRFTIACLERTAEVERNRGLFSDRAYELAAACTVGVDCCASGQVVPDFSETKDRPHWKLKSGTLNFSKFRAETVCGMIFEAGHPATDNCADEIILSASRLMLKEFSNEAVQSGIQHVCQTMRELASSLSDVRARPFSRNFKQMAENRVLRRIQAGLRGIALDKSLLGSAAYIVYAACKDHVYPDITVPDIPSALVGFRSVHDFEKLLWRIFLPCICRAVADSHGGMARSVALKRRKGLRIRRSTLHPV